MHPKVMFAAPVQAHTHCTDWVHVPKALDMFASWCYSAACIYVAVTLGIQPTGWYNKTYDINIIIDISVTYVYMHALYYVLLAGQEIQ